MIYEGKKLLILGGAAQHVKLAEAAKELGIITYVVDYLPVEKSPAKQIADYNYEYNIYDIDSIIELCKKEKIDGVLATHLDPCQKPYQQICSTLGLPCYAPKHAFEVMTNKCNFKKCCKQYDVGTIAEYTVDDINSDRVIYPVFIKPTDSRGSRGQTVCYDKESAVIAIENAKKESSNDGIIIEQYISNAQEVQFTYFFINGEAYLIRTADSYCGLESEKMNKVVECAVSPSRYTNVYLEQTHNNVVKMFKSLGIENGPVFMQGFYDGKTFMFFDPGIRFPGVDYERIYKKVYETDIMKMMVKYAIQGAFDENFLPADMYRLKGKCACIMFPTLAKGIVDCIVGKDEITKMKEVISFLMRVYEDDKIEWTYNVNQRSAEIDLLCETMDDLKRTILYIQDNYKIYDSCGNDMTYSNFDIGRLVL